MERPPFVAPEQPTGSINGRLANSQYGPAPSTTLNPIAHGSMAPPPNPNVGVNGGTAPNPLDLKQLQHRQNIDAFINDANAAGSPDMLFKRNRNRPSTQHYLRHIISNVAVPDAYLPALPADLDMSSFSTESFVVSTDRLGRRSRFSFRLEFPSRPTPTLLISRTVA